MTTRTRLVAVVALSVCAGALTVAQQRDRAVRPMPTGTASIAGRVTIDVDGRIQPVRRARVTVESSALDRPRQVDTDTDGRYQLTQLPAGTYTVRAEKAGFVPRLADLRRAFQRPESFEVAAGVAVSRDLPMVRGAAIEGQVLDGASQPAANIVVSALRFVYDENGRRPAPVGQTRTDDRGRFRVHTLPAGEYYLEAAPDPLDALTRPAVPGQPATTLERTYYPGAPRIDGGQTISLALGATTSDLVVVLPRVQTAALRGRVLDSTGAATPNSMVRIQRAGGPVGEVRGTVNPSNQVFSYPSVPSGTYWLMGVARPAPGAPLEFAATPLTVAGQDLTDLVVSTTRGAPVRGHVTVAAGSLPPGRTLEVRAVPTEFELPSLPGEPPLTTPATVAADGAFSFDHLFGPTLFRVTGLPPGWALERVSVDEAVVTDTPVDLRGATPRQVQIIVTSRTTTLSGSVRDDAGQPAGRARVVVFADDATMWGWRSRWIGSAEADANGRYALEGLLPGAYRVVAVPFLEDHSWRDPLILNRLHPVAAPITLREAAHTADLVVKR